jgi:hypothetical protein
MENLLADLAGESPKLHELLDDMLDFNLRWIDRWTKLEYDGLHFGDDWGGQRSLLIRPEAWRRIFKPRYAAMFEPARAAGMDIWFHSDGYVNEIVGDLIEIGAHVLNIQSAVVGHDWIAENARGVWPSGRISTANASSFGSPAEERRISGHLRPAARPKEDPSPGEVGPDVPSKHPGHVRPSGNSATWLGMCFVAAALSRDALLLQVNHDDHPHFTPPQYMIAPDGLGGRFVICIFS